MAHPLVGTWRLVSWEHRTSDGQVSSPFDGHASGYIMYTEDGHMSVQIMASGRPRFAGGDLFESTPDEATAAYQTYLAYCGTYEIQPGKVIHHIEVSLFPNWIGVAQERFIELSGDTLTIRTPPILSHGLERTSRLVWHRA
jgi:hypothetical protein